MSKNFVTVAWAINSNIYEVNIRQYTAEGTFEAFEKHLSRLKNMGVEILWLIPVTPISIEKRLGSLGSYYACSSYVEINPEFGTKKDLKSLIDAAHKLDLKIIIDWVANHTGWDHEWTVEHPEWYKKDDEGNFTETHGWKDVIDLNYNVAELRTAMIEAMMYWIKEFDIDGFRCDMADLVPLDFWNEARMKCDAVKPLFWLAECEDINYHEVFDVSYAWEWMHVSEKYMKNTALLNDVKNVLGKYLQYPEGAQKLYFTSNHDENSWNGTEYEKYGNAAKAFAVFTFTWPGTALIYSGQELPNLKRLSFFDKDEIDWQMHQPMLNEFYKKLLSLKNANTSIQIKPVVNIFPTEFDDKILAYLCLTESNKILILINFSNQDKLKFTISDKNLEGTFKNVFSEIEYSFNSTCLFELQQWEYIIYKNVTADFLDEAH